MITKQTSFATTDGQLFGTVDAAQLHELEAFLKDAQLPEDTDCASLACLLISKKDHIVDIMTMKATSHPKARKVNKKAAAKVKESQPQPA